MNEINIVVVPCAECGGAMSVTGAWVEDAGVAGVIECACKQCGAHVIIKAAIREEEV